MSDRSYLATLIVVDVLTFAITLTALDVLAGYSLADNLTLAALSTAAVNTVIAIANIARS